MYTYIQVPEVGMFIFMFLTYTHIFMIYGVEYQCFYTEANSQHNTLNNVKYLIYFSIQTKIGLCINKHICNKMISTNKVNFQNNF